jgi:hypothetical protein
VDHIAEGIGDGGNIAVLVVTEAGEVTVFVSDAGAVLVLVVGEYGLIREWISYTDQTKLLIVSVDRSVAEGIGDAGIAVRSIYRGL